MTATMIHQNVEEHIMLLDDAFAATGNIFTVVVILETVASA